MRMTYVSGSNEIPLAQLLFFKDGTMMLAETDDCAKKDLSSLLLVVDFFSYALSRKDWMSYYVHEIKKEHKTLAEEKRSRFRIIQGGITGSVDI